MIMLEMVHVLVGIAVVCECMRLLLAFSDCSDPGGGSVHPVKRKLIHLDKKHTESWQILPRSCHGTYPENINILSNL